MEIAEKIAVGGLSEKLEIKCPFEDDIKGVSEKDNESIADDDSDDVQEAQSNNGGTLGRNLNNGSNGKEGTWEGAPYEPPAGQESLANDSKRKNGQKGAKVWQKVQVPGTAAITDRAFPFTVAAHHLIPGNASLYNDENNLKKYMIQGETVKADGKTWEIKYHIGYNVNGAHNGVWLPGNYAIRAKASPTGVTWGKMGNEDWQLNYVAACVKVTGGQFHDGHCDYNEAVQKLMNKIALKLQIHQAHCKLCEKKQGKKIPPPYLIKQRLYNLSGYFRQQLTKHPQGWRRPWFTSDRWREVVFKNNAEKACKEFMEAYGKAKIEVIKEN